MIVLCFALTHSSWATRGWLGSCCYVKRYRDTRNRFVNIKLLHACRTDRSPNTAFHAHVHLIVESEHIPRMTSLLSVRLPRSSRSSRSSRSTAVAKLLSVELGRHVRTEAITVVVIDTAKG